jgi:hypothetical protein
VRQSSRVLARQLRSGKSQFFAVREAILNWRHSSTEHRSTQLGGTPGGTRTPDILRVKQALYQLSYGRERTMAS